MNIKIKFGNILEFNGSAIVNTVNSHLSEGFGLDGQVRKHGGAQLISQLSRYKKCDVGHVVVTSGGRLKQQYVIHAVGPIWKGGRFEEEELLRQTYVNIFTEAEKLNVSKIAIPNISTGIFRFPKEKAADIAIASLKTFSFKSVKEVIFYCFEKENYNIYQSKTSDLVSIN